MKIVVFGSTGGVGQHVVRLAAEAGHAVTAFARSPEKLELPETLKVTSAPQAAPGAVPAVRVVQGDAFDAAAVADGLEGQDAVISCLSSSAPMKKSTEVARMTQNIVVGMQASGVDRIAYCASAGVDDELTGLIGKSVTWLLRHALADHRAALEHIKAADLNFTIARPMSLSNAEFDQHYLESLTGVPGSGAIPQASVAHFLVKAVEQPKNYSRTSVGLALESRRR